MSSVPSVPVKQPNLSKSLYPFSEILDVKPSTDVRRLYAYKAKRKAIIVGSILWPVILKQRGNTKIYECVKIDLYNWILQHPQVVQSPISIDCLK